MAVSNTASDEQTGSEEGGVEKGVPSDGTFGGMERL